MKRTSILLGRIGAAHGIRGEVLVTSFAEVPEDIAAYGPLADASGGRRFALKVVRVTAKGVVARIAGVGDRTAAEALRGIDLYVDRDRLPPPDADTFYHADLIGLAAVTPAGEAVGTVVGVPNYGAGDLVEIRLTGSSRTELVPFADAFVPHIDVAAGRLTVIMPEPDTDEPDTDEPGPDDADEPEAGKPDQTGG